MMIGHRCRTCRHPDMWSLNCKREGSIAKGFTVGGQRVTDQRMVRNRCHECATCRNGCDWGPSELFPRYEPTPAPYGTIVAGLLEPGVNTGGAAVGQRIYGCACDDCQALYIASLATYPQWTPPDMSGLPERIVFEIPTGHVERYDDANAQAGANTATVHTT